MDIIEYNLIYRNYTGYGCDWICLNIMLSMGKIHFIYIKIIPDMDAIGYDSA